MRISRVVVAKSAIPHSAGDSVSCLVHSTTGWLIGVIVVLVVVRITILLLVLVPVRMVAMKMRYFWHMFVDSVIVFVHAFVDAFEPKFLVCGQDLQQSLRRRSSTYD